MLPTSIFDHQDPMSVINFRLDNLPINIKQNARVVPMTGRYLKLFADEIALLSPSELTALQM